MTTKEVLGVINELLLELSKRENSATLEYILTCMDIGDEYFNEVKKAIETELYK